MSGAGAVPRVPVELRLDRAARCLVVDFGAGRSWRLPAETRGHGPGQAKRVHGRREVGILQIEPVGNYAVRLIFDDLHDTGIYSWAYLDQLGEEHPTRWPAYLAALAVQGGSRDPRGAAG
jgi:DUF971 family protein